MLPFEFFDHTADVGLSARGGSLPELFQNAALGVTAAMIDTSTVQPGGIRERVAARAPDRGTLLVQWLNEVIFLFTVQRMVFCRFQVKAFSEGSPDGKGCSIEAEAEGELLDPGRHDLLREVKAATFHDLKIEESGGLWRASVILDV
jgi:SHS2 domain-containing protein